MPLANCQSISTGRKNMATYYLTNGTMQSLETVLQLALDYLYLKTILETILQNQWYRSSTFTKSIYYHHCYQLMPLPGSLPSGADQFSSGENHRPSFSTSLVSLLHPSGGYSNTDMAAFQSGQFTSTINKKTCTTETDWPKRSRIF
jgi:hypothetical protein